VIALARVGRGAFVPGQQIDGVITVATMPDGLVITAEISW
jgi:hypothetical protein